MGGVRSLRRFPFRNIASSMMIRYSESERITARNREHSSHGNTSFNENPMQ